MDAKALLMALEAALARVAETGARYLSVASASAADGPSDSGAGALGETPLPADRTEHSFVSEIPAGRPLYGQPDAGCAASAIEALQFEFRNCLACKLGPTRKRLVFGTGAARPRLLFLGEGPGAEEDEQGLPFVGRAGALLTGFIRALGLTRDDVYITNVVKCRPPQNRTPEPDEVVSCRPILLRQIEILDPGLIVTLGNVPLKALNPQAGGITKERGRPFQFLRWRVLPTFHPSYLLRNPAGIPDCWMDLRAAFRIVYPDGEAGGAQFDAKR